MKQAYIDKKLNTANRKLVTIMERIADQYSAAGYVMTTRQLYYQLVSGDYIANTLQEYKRVASIINDAKLTGLLDWDAFEDRTRAFERRSHWEDPEQMVRISAEQFFIDMWENQERRVFAIVEKEALVGVLNRVCSKFDVPLLAARGYPSATVLREFAERDLHWASRAGQSILILHLGDHDPSGIDMTRDLQERLSLFTNSHIDLRRIALNMEQVEAEQPPENPAKTSDSRFADYQALFGDSSWELDALPPEYLDALLTEQIRECIDESAWHEREKEIVEGRVSLHEAADYIEAGNPDYEDKDEDGPLRMANAEFQSALD